MKKDHYRWVLGEKPPEIQEHSIAKHRVLEEYIRKYIETLTVHPGMEHFRLFVVDGFSGGGEYTLAGTKEVVSGSPLRLAKGIEMGVDASNLERRKKFHPDIHLYLVDKNKDAISYLKESFYDKINDSKNYITPHFICGNFDEQLDFICQDITSRRGKKHRVIFVLDQYGYKEVPVNLIRKIFKELPFSEIIFTFSVDYIIDYLQDDPSFLETVSNSTGIPDGEVKSWLEIKQEEDYRPVIQVGLIKNLIKNVGYEFFTPFFIMSRNSNKAYWLIHLSNHPKARDVMVSLHWQIKNHFVHYGRPGLEMLGFDPFHENQFPYFFEKHDRATTVEKLGEQIPKRIPYDGIEFIELFSAICNETTSTLKMFEEVIVELRNIGDVEIFPQDGTQRLRARKIQATDVIKPSPQRRFVFAGSGSRPRQ